MKQPIVEVHASKTGREPIDETRCLKAAPGKTNVLLLGNSHAAHLYPGLARIVDQRHGHLMQATHAGCMPMSAPDPTGPIACYEFDQQMRSYFATHTPDIVILSSDWVEHGRQNHFAGMIANIEHLAASLTAKGAIVVVLGPSIQFTSPLPELLARSQMRGGISDARDIEVRGVFEMDARMKAALPAAGPLRFVSIVDTVCPERKCPLYVDNDIPLTWDYGHLTVEGSVFVMNAIADQILPAKAAAKAE